MTLNEFSASIQSLTGIDAILIAHRSAAAHNKLKHSDSDPCEQLLDAVFAHGLEQQYADLIDELIPRVEFNPQIELLPYPIRKSVSHAVSLGCAAITGQGVISEGLTELFLEVFQSPKIPPSTQWGGWRSAADQFSA